MKQPDTPYLFTIEEAIIIYCLRYGSDSFTIPELYRCIHKMKKSYSGMGYVGRPFRHSKYVGDLREFSIQIIDHFKIFSDLFTVISYSDNPIESIITLNISVQKLANMIKIGTFEKDWRFKNLKRVTKESIEWMYKIINKNEDEDDIFHTNRFIIGK